MSRGARNYMFTVFGDGEDPLRLLDVSSWLDQGWVTYVIYQRELCPDTAREHFQGYMEFNVQKRYTEIHAQLDGMSNAHLEPRRGPQHAAIAYCSKEDTRIEGPWIFGEPKNQGQRQDLDAVKADLDKGYTIKRIADEHFHTWVRYPAALKQYRRMNQGRRNWPMQLIFLIGPTGTGKTKEAMRLVSGLPDHDVYFKDLGKWWDEYDGQHTVVLDEFYGNWMPFSVLLRLCDRTPMSVECKGATVEFTSRRLIFTSNQDPSEWYDVSRTHQGVWESNPLRRRIQEYGQLIYTGEVHRAPPVLVAAPAADFPAPSAGPNPRASRVDGSAFDLPEWEVRMN